MLVAAGWSLLLFALFYWAVEQRGWGKQAGASGSGWPWLVFGSNAIVAYMISELLGSAIELIRFPSNGQRRRAQLCVHACLCANCRSGLESLGLLRVVHSDLLSSGVGALSQEDLRKGMICPRDFARAGMRCVVIPVCRHRLHSVAWFGTRRTDYRET